MRIHPPQITLKESINKLEDSIITLSGPALAISGIIAGVDLLTGGNALRQYGGLALTWAICLLLTLDFQVLGLGAKAHKVYLSDKMTRRKVTEIVLAVCIAAAISYVSIQMQSIIARANSVGISVEQATVQLGINPIALTWERSALVLVLIFMSGWFREEQGVHPEQTHRSEVNTLNITADTVNIIMELKQEVEALKLAVTQPQLPAVNTPLIAAPAQVNTLDSPVDTGVDSASSEIEQKIRAEYALDSTLTGCAIAEKVGCSPTTANKWIKRIQEGK